MGAGGIAGSKDEHKHVVGGLNVVVVATHFDGYDILRVLDSGQSGTCIFAEAQSNITQVLVVGNGHGAGFESANLELSELGRFLGHVDLTSSVVAISKEEMAIDTNVARTMGLGWLLRVEGGATGALVLNVGSSNTLTGLSGLSGASLGEAISGAVGYSAEIGRAFRGPSA